MNTLLMNYIFPMPLKHSQETWLIVLLGAVIVLTGVVMTVLPPLSVSGMPWLIAFAVSVAYPLALYPLLKSRRADYEFRALHFTPAMMLLLWVALQFLHDRVPATEGMLWWYTWGWSLPAVTLAIVLLLLFCLRVIRQWIPRVAVLLLLFASFVLASLAGESWGWDRQLASAIWPASWSSSGSMLAGTGSTKNLASSEHPDEEQWREALRQMERRARDVQNGDSSGGTLSASSSTNATTSSVASVRGAFDGALVSVGVLPRRGSDSSSSRPLIAQQASSKAPPRLPTSGFGLEFALPLLLAGYTGTVHRRAMKRSQRS